MASIVPFNSDNAVALANRFAKFAYINDEVVSSRGDYPVISIKGGKFTVVRDGNRQVLTKPDEPDEVAQSIQVVIVRANLHARQFYASDYVEGESEGNKPACYSSDGVAPAADAEDKQSKKCALCPHAVWGSGKNGKGSACKSTVRIAVSTPDKLEDPYLVRVPPASFTDKENKNGIKDFLRIAKDRGIPYNAILVKIGFDRESPSPKLTFKPVGILGDDAFDTTVELFDSEIVQQIVGVAAKAEAGEAKPKKDEVANEIDAAFEALQASRKAPAKKAPVVEDDEEEAPKPVKKAKPVVEDDEDEYVAPKKKAKPVVEDDEDEAPKPKKAKSVGDDLLASLDDVLGSTDD